MITRNSCKKGGPIEICHVLSSIHTLIVFCYEHFTFSAKKSWLSFMASTPTALEFFQSAFSICLLITQNGAKKQGASTHHTFL